MVNASVSGTPILVKNTTDYLDNFSSAASFAANVGAYGAREAGTLGNSLKVSVCSNSTAFGPHSMSGNLVADASAAIGDTSITVDDGGLMQVGDILEFGDASNVPSTERCTFWILLQDNCNINKLTNNRKIQSSNRSN